MPKIMSKINVCNNSHCLKIVPVVLSILLTSCTNTLMNPDSQTTPEKIELKTSFLETQGVKTYLDEDQLQEDEKSEGSFTRLTSINGNNQGFKLEVDLSNEFDSKTKHQVSVNELPLNDFLHYALGELLNVSYLIEPSVKSNDSPVTLELKEAVSSKRLFQLIQQIVNQHNITIDLSESVFYVHPIAKKGSKSGLAFGYGRNESDVPSVSSDIIQMVPLKFGTKGTLKRLITSLVDAKVTVDSQQGFLSIQGKRQQIIRALSLVQLLDSNSIHNKAVALLSFSYIDSQTFIDKVTELLAQEGIGASRTLNNSINVQFVPIEHLGQVVVFASADEIISRVEYWSKQLDKPATGSEQSFYIYHPKYARAADLGESLSPLLSSQQGNRLGSRNASVNNTTNAANNSNQNRSQNNTQKTNNQSTGGASVTIEGDNLRLVVDERSNSLIFYSTGKFYKELLPIIKKLDIMPKQVMLEVVIAEVKLTGSFAKGVDFAIENGSLGDTTNKVSFDSEGGFGYSVVGFNGNINVNFKQTDGLINVLSRPTILVRDGVAASISVGDDIPTVGSTTSDPINGERETTTIQYRKTGIDLVVTPTINAQGTVIMTIEQNISNVSINGATISGTPSIFERKLSTEVVAGDGQTVMLGGLISENSNTNASSVPWLGSLPLIGHLFRSDSESSDKTELVVLVTPKIIHNINEWERIQNSFIKGLENIKF